MATTQVSAQSVPSGVPPGLRLGPASAHPSSTHPSSNGDSSHGFATEASDRGSVVGGLVTHGQVNAHPAGGNEQVVDDADTFLPLSGAFARMPVGLVVSVPVREFRVRTLLARAAGSVIETLWGVGEDLPLSSGDVQLAWSEFEVVDTRLAVRVTRLA